MNIKHKHGYVTGRDGAVIPSYVHSQCISMSRYLVELCSHYTCHAIPMFLVWWIICYYEVAFVIRVFIWKLREKKYGLGKRKQIEKSCVSSQRKKEGCRLTNARFCDVVLLQEVA